MDISGDSVLSVASGLRHYLRRFLNSSISWRGDSMAVWYIYLPKSTKDGMPSFEYHVEVLGTHDDSRSSWVWKKLTSMWRYLTSTENPVLYRLDIPLHVLED